MVIEAPPGPAPGARNCLLEDWPRIHRPVNAWPSPGRVATLVAAAISMMSANSITY
jgi:hypothetical protein